MSKKLCFDCEPVESSIEQYAYHDTAGFIVAEIWKSDIMGYPAYLWDAWAIPNDYSDGTGGSATTLEEAKAIVRAVLKKYGFTILDPRLKVMK